MKRKKKKKCSHSIDLLRSEERERKIDKGTEREELAERKQQRDTKGEKKKKEREQGRERKKKESRHARSVNPCQRVQGLESSPGTHPFTDLGIIIQIVRIARERLI